MESISTIRPFSASVLIKAVDAQEGKHIVYGPVASAQKDYDDEILEKAGVWKGLDMHTRLGGHVDWEHLYSKTKDPDTLIGIGVKKALVDGVAHLATRLKVGQIPLADKVWNMAQRGDHLGYSLEGIAKARDPKNPKRILETEIHRVTISPSPKGFDNWIKAGDMPDLATVAKAIASEFEAGDCAMWQPVDYNPGKVFYSFPSGIELKSVDVQSAIIPQGADHHEPAGEAAQKRHTCPECGGSMYCIHCHNASKRGNRDMKKSATTTGEGIVTAGDGAPGDASKVRVQQIGLCKKCGKRHRGACKGALQDTRKAITLTSILDGVGFAHPELIARLIRKNSK